MIRQGPPRDARRPPTCVERRRHPALHGSPQGLQCGVGQAFEQEPLAFLQADLGTAQRDLFRAGLAATRLRALPCEGSYFQLVDYSAVSSLPEAEFCQWLTREVGVAAIPLSAFYGDGFDQRVVRFCFAKKDETLQSALERLAKL
jgi:methionine aminotransferase